jgi:protein-S-isoprenylcysteine O-methyltransferase Ste14
MVSQSIFLAPAYRLVSAADLPVPGAAWLLAAAPDGQTAGISPPGENLLQLEKTTQLVQTSAYRYIRHPLYSSLFFLTWGIFFKAPGWVGLLLAGAATFCLLRTAQCEEAENLRYFGPPYQDYMRQTRRFIPYIF